MRQPGSPTSWRNRPWCTCRHDQQLVQGIRLVAQTLVLEQSALSTPDGEVLDGLHLMYPFAGVAQLGPAHQVVLGGLGRPLNACGELAWLGGPLVGAGEIADEDV